MALFYPHLTSLKDPFPLQEWSVLLVKEVKIHWSNKPSSTELIPSIKIWINQTSQKACFKFWKKLEITVILLKTYEFESIRSITYYFYFGFCTRHLSLDDMQIKYFSEWHRLLRRSISYLTRLLTLNVRVLVILWEK